MWTNNNWNNSGGGGSIPLGTYKGFYNASTNTPTLVNGTGTVGDFYITSVAGNDTPGGVTLVVNQIFAYNGTLWEPGGIIGNTDDLVVANDYVEIFGQIVAVGQTATEALGILQGQLATINMSQGTYTPTITVIAGVTGSASGISGSYNGTGSGAGAIINASIQFNITTNNTGNLVQLTITNPIANAISAQLISLTAVPTANIGSGGNIGSSQANSISISSGKIDITFELNQISTLYTVYLSWQAELS